MISYLRKSVPTPLKPALAAAYNLLHELAPDRIAAKWWVRKRYTAHNMRLRNDIFLTIANFAHINRPIRGYYMEFGCHGANTMRMAWDNFRHLFDWHFVGFDSFQGLPEIGDIDQQDIWKRGKLTTEEAEFIRLCTKHGMPGSRLKTIPGFYSDTLTDETRRKLPGKAAVVYVDCDLYESTVHVLSFVKAYLQPGTVIVFDDWNCFRADPHRGERRAWREFCELNPEYQFERMVENGLQMAFVCVGPK